LTRELLKRNEKVLVVTHSPDKVEAIKSIGAQAAVADVLDTYRLHEVFKKGKRLFLLNPPADPSADIDIEERRSIRSILSALKGSGLEKIVAESTYGAQPGDSLGDLGVLYEMEQGLEAQEIPATIIRSAYYYSNWDMALESAKNEGKLYTFFPADFRLPMVAPADIAKLAAQLLIEPVNKKKLCYRSGPEDYSPTDVAAAFSKALKKPVEVAEIPKEEWVSTMMQAGYSSKSAESMAYMTEVTLRNHEQPQNPERGTITIDEYIGNLMK